MTEAEMNADTTKMIGEMLPYVEGREMCVVIPVLLALITEVTRQIDDPETIMRTAMSLSMAGRDVAAKVMPAPPGRAH